MQTVRNLVRNGRLKKLTWGARGGSTVNKVLGSGEPLRNSMRMPGDAGKAARGGFRPSDTPLGFSAWAW